MSTSTRREIVINAVVFVTLIALAGWYLATSVYDWTPWEKSKTVTMRVHNTTLVLTETGVCVNGVPVGAVHGVTLTPDGAELSLRYPAAQNIPSNATVAIGLQSALGEPYINFVPGPSESPPLPDGAVVDANQISEPESIPGIFRQISLLSQVVSVDPVAGVLNSVWQSLDGTDAALDQISLGSRLVASVLLSRSAQMRTMFTNTQVYTSDLGWLVNTLPEFSTGLRAVLIHIKSALVGLEKLVYTTDFDNTVRNVVHPFLARLNPYMSDILPNTLDAVGPLLPIANALNETLPQIDMSDLLSRALAIFGAGDAARLVITPAPSGPP
ncbi:MlaD family protein [Gordonia bronchialis]|uniref:MlaD family protein n=1 Tax=Gordonia bronchialis TaxID=2054 RepID=UPI0022714C35|nr:MlaD family protein [Gordonia bronchialis]